MSLYQKIFAVLFLILLLGFAAGNFWYMKEDLLTDVLALETPEDSQQFDAYIASVDDIIVDDLVGGHIWNEIYGGVCRVLGKHEENGFAVAEDKSGVLVYTNFEEWADLDAREIAYRLRWLQEYVNEDGGEMLFLLCPGKYNEAWSNPYYGMPYTDENGYADELLKNLRWYNVEYIDYREELINAGKTDITEIFYKTDHHWTVPTGFWAADVFIEKLNTAFDAELDLDGYYRDIDNYTVTVYENFFMGSMGRETGEAYVGLEDFVYILPDFHTDYEYTMKYGEVLTTRSGSIESSLTFPQYFAYDSPYDRTLDNVYLNSIAEKDHIKNNLNPDGPKILFIRDSYVSPVAVFAAPNFSELDLIWAIYYSQDEILEMIDEGHYDYVIVEVTAEDVADVERYPFGIVDTNSEEEEE